ncbi:MAG: alanine--tRNA ligase [Gaiellaceae bacterium]
MRTTDELREGFLAFFEGRGHLRQPSASLVPATHDPTVLLTTAGMQPLKPYFLGAAKAPADRLVTVQKCFRTTDIDSVGLTARHLTFFEMLGNFSLGDYFKQGAIELAWEFVTEQMKLPHERLWATVFAGDPELRLGEDEVAIEEWQNIGIPADRIRGLPRSENFWQAGPVGPCGPCSELYLDLGVELGCDRATCGPGCECDRFLEFWNLVFMELNLHEDGTLTPLPTQNIDTGLGLERGASILQDVRSVYDTDGFQAIIEWVHSASGTAYSASEDATKAHRVLADHGRSMTVLAGDGVMPSNEGRGYVLRRVVRRAVQHGTRLGLEPPFVSELAGVVIELMGPVYPELVEHRDRIQAGLADEEQRFARTLSTGMRLFEEVLERSPGGIAVEDAFRLHDTHGFPLELTRELAHEQGLTLDVDAFNDLMSQQRTRSRAGRGDETDRAATFTVDAGFSTEFVGYEKLDVLTQLAAVESLEGDLFLGKLRESPFYPEGGGQVSDTGWIELESGERAELVAVYRLGEDQALLLRGAGFTAGDRVRAVVPWSVRFPTQANHTATHLLHGALRAVLGDHVKQAGSAVRPDKLRFDFSHSSALTGEERARVEEIVNEWIFDNHPVRTFETPLAEAREQGVTMLFGERYGDIVRVVEVGDFSAELCGGAHVSSSAELGTFKVLSETSTGASTRRIEAITSGAAGAYLFEKEREAARLLDELDSERRARAKDKKKTQVVESAGVAEQLVAGGSELGDIRVVVASAGELDPDGLLALSDQVKQRAAPAAVVLAAIADGKVNVVANFSSEAASAGAHAGAVVRAACSAVGGGGGGRDTMARGAGADVDKVDDALNAAEQALKDSLA